MKDSPATDNNDLASFGYRQELKRSMGSFSSFAAGFSYISILTGLFQMFYLGYGVAGPGFFWTWPFVLAGQLLVALCFAELASRFPLSGGVYQWAKFTGNPFLGWMTGWIYMACLIVTLAAVAMALQVSLPQISSSFQVIGASSDPKSVAMNAILLGSILIVISTIVNARGIKLLALINNIGVFAELVGIIFLIVLLFLNRVRSPIEAVVHIKHAGSAFKSFPNMKILMAASALTASYVLYGFDTAGTLAEETHDPRKKAPRAILQALLAAGFAGLLVLLFALMAVPDLGMPDLGNINGGLPMLVKSVLGDTTKVHTMMAKITIQRKSLPVVSPNTDFTNIGNPPLILPKYAIPKSGAAIKAKSNTSNPPIPAARSACKIARGAFLRGSWVSSASVPAVSNP